MAIKGRKTAMSAEDNKIGGLNVYHDEKGRPVYLNRMNHVGYVLTDKTKPFRTYSSRFFIGGIAAIFAYMFELPLIMCIFLGIAAYALMEFKFRKFLQTLPQIPNFKPVNHMGTIQSEANLDTKKIIIKIFLFIALSVLLIVNAYQQGYEGVILYLNWAIAVAAAIMCIIEIRAFLFKKNNVG